MGNQEEESKAEKILNFLGIPDFLFKQYHHHPQQEQNSQHQQDVKGESEKPRVGEPSGAFNGRTYFTQAEILEAAISLVNSIRTDFSRTQFIDDQGSYEVNDSTTVVIYRYYNLLMPDTNQELQVLKYKKLPLSKLKDLLLTVQRFQKKVFIPAAMLQLFMLTLYKNTKNNIQSCGLLSGKLVNEMYYVSALIILIQDATFDSAEEAISSFERRKNLTRLGRIYLKPSDDCCSLSPSEIHTQYTLQEKLPEVFSVVIAPHDKARQYGIYRLTDVGMSVIGGCKQQQNDEHEERSPDGYRIYYNCRHVHLIPMDKFEIRFFSSSRISRKKTS